MFQAICEINQVKIISERKAKKNNHNKNNKQITKTIARPMWSHQCVSKNVVLKKRRAHTHAYKM